jgi:hypothetical protein
LSFSHKDGRKGEKKLKKKHKNTFNIIKGTVFEVPNPLEVQHGTKKDNGK